MIGAVLVTDLPPESTLQIPSPSWYHIHNINLADCWQKYNSPRKILTIDQNDHYRGFHEILLATLYLSPIFLLLQFSFQL